MTIPILLTSNKHFLLMPFNYWRSISSFKISQRKRNTNIASYCKIRFSKTRLFLDSIQPPFAQLMQPIENLSKHALAAQKFARPATLTGSQKAQVRLKDPAMPNASQSGPMAKDAMWSNFWTDFQSKHDWRFPEVPPWQIHRDLDYPIVDHSESLRAEWLWRRRPREIIGGFGYVLLIAISILVLLIPLLGLFLEAAWLFTCFMFVALDVVRNVRWRRDYEASLCRLIRTMRHPGSI